MVEHAGLSIEMGDALAAIKQLAKARSQGNFGNAGAVSNLLSEAKLKMMAERPDTSRLIKVFDRKQQT